MFPGSSVLWDCTFHNTKFSSLLKCFLSSPCLILCHGQRHLHRNWNIFCLVILPACDGWLTWSHIILHVCSGTRQIVYTRKPQGCPVASVERAQQSPTCVQNIWQDLRQRLNLHFLLQGQFIKGDWRSHLHYMQMDLSPRFKPSFNKLIQRRISVQKSLFLYNL